MKRYSISSKLLMVCCIIILIGLIVSPSYSENSDGKCEDGLLRCLVAAGLTSLSNYKVALGIAVWCIDGYLWCKQFYAEN
jgi:hypothetical protein